MGFPGCAAMRSETSRASTCSVFTTVAPHRGNASMAAASAVRCFMLRIKSHIVFMVSWFAGLFYLPQPVLPVAIVIFVMVKPF